MEFHEKLQKLRKEKGLTQEELAAQLYVSRTAISKWESGRGYPNIESLKAISKLFSVTVDELLSGNELLSMAADKEEKLSDFRNLVFGLLDVSVFIFLFLPIFAQRMDGALQEVSLLNLATIAPYLRVAYLLAVGCSIAFGILLLALQNYRCQFWIRHKYALSFAISIAGVILFIIGSQPYGAGIWFLFLLFKALLLWKKG